MSIKFKNEFKKDVFEGLQKKNKSIPSKYFYNKKGSELFDKICSLNEYYPTRTEIYILKKYIDQIKNYTQNNLNIFEFGAGSVFKIRILLDNLNIENYVPIDISLDYLNHHTKILSKDYKHISITPLFGDFSKNMECPKNFINKKNKMGFFPGSTIGNFEPVKAGKILNNLGKFLGNNSYLLIGVDLKKNSKILNKKYNDKKGITAKFNLNLLKRINQELNANFDINSFKHYAFYNDSLGRIEMHIKSEKDQIVKIREKEFIFKKNETIHSENSYKYSIDEFKKITNNNNYITESVWVDEEKLFSIHLLKFLGK